MPSFRTTRRVKHSAADMFDLVADIERYPEFVPLCRRLTVLRRAETGEGTRTLDATMDVAYGPFHESFTTRCTQDRPRLAVLVEYLDGPFDYLENRWRFRPAGDKACDVDFYIAYEFRSRLLGMVMGSVFETAFRHFAEAFERRAEEIYRVSG
jgi:coenzyme Q-binding protein COQ10